MEEGRDSREKVRSCFDCDAAEAERVGVAAAAQTNARREGRFEADERAQNVQIITGIKDAGRRAAEVAGDSDYSESVDTGASDEAAAAAQGRARTPPALSPRARA